MIFPYNHVAALLGKFFVAFCVLDIRKCRIICDFSLSIIFQHSLYGYIVNFARRVCLGIDSFRFICFVAAFVSTFVTIRCLSILTGVLICICCLGFFMTAIVSFSRLFCRNLILRCFDLLRTTAHNRRYQRSHNKHRCQYKHSCLFS